MLRRARTIHRLRRFYQSCLQARGSLPLLRVHTGFYQKWVCSIVAKRRRVGGNENEETVRYAVFEQVGDYRGILL